MQSFVFMILKIIFVLTFFNKVFLKYVTNPFSSYDVSIS